MQVQVKYFLRRNILVFTLPALHHAIYNVLVRAHEHVRVSGRGSDCGGSDEGARAKVPGVVAVEGGHEGG